MVASQPVSPRDSDLVDLDHGLVQADEIAEALERALRGWQTDQDPRQLRRNMLQLLAALD